MSAGTGLYPVYSGNTNVKLQVNQPCTGLFHDALLLLKKKTVTKTSVSMAEHSLPFRTGWGVPIFSWLEFVPLRAQEKIGGETKATETH